MNFLFNWCFNGNSERTGALRSNLAWFRCYLVFYLVSRDQFTFNFDVSWIDSSVRYLKFSLLLIINREDSCIYLKLRALNERVVISCMKLNFLLTTFSGNCYYIKYLVFKTINQLEKDSELQSHPRCNGWDILKVGFEKLNLLRFYQSKTLRFRWNILNSYKLLLLRSFFHFCKTNVICR